MSKSLLDHDKLTAEFTAMEAKLSGPEFKDAAPGDIQLNRALMIGQIVQQSLGPKAKVWTKVGKRGTEVHISYPRGTS